VEAHQLAAQDCQEFAITEVFEHEYRVLRKNKKLWFRVRWSSIKVEWIGANQCKSGDVWNDAVRQYMVLHGLV